MQPDKKAWFYYYWTHAGWMACIVYGKDNSDRPVAKPEERWSTIWDVPIDSLVTECMKIHPPPEPPK